MILCTITSIQACVIANKSGARKRLWGGIILVNGKRESDVPYNLPIFAVFTTQKNTETEDFEKKSRIIYVNGKGR